MDSKKKTKKNREFSVEKMTICVNGKGVGEKVSRFEFLHSYLLTNQRCYYNSAENVVISVNKMCCLLRNLKAGFIKSSTKFSLLKHRYSKIY